jgi:hypothetical protein
VGAGGTAAFDLLAERRVSWPTYGQSDTAVREQVKLSVLGSNLTSDT